jgi:hypothetical protein
MYKNVILKLGITHIYTTKMATGKLVKYIDTVMSNNNDYGEYFIKHISKSIFNTELSKLSSIDTSIDESKLKSKNYTQLKNKLKKLLVSVEIKNFIEKLNNELLNINIPSDNNNIILLQIFYYINQIYIQNDTVVKYLLMEFSNNCYENTPKIGIANNLRNRCTTNINSFRKYIFQDTYEALWQCKYDNKLKFYNFIKSFDNDIIYINMINNINDFYKINGRKMYKLAYYLYNYLRDNYKLNIHNTNNFLSQQFNQNNDINQFIFEYFSIKKSQEYSYLLKIINCYKNIKPNIKDNRNLFLFYIELNVNNIFKTLDDKYIELFKKLFYKNIESYWLKNISTPIFFNENNEYLFDFSSWNMSNEQYNEVINIINETYDDINKSIKIIKKKAVKKTNKTISKALKSKVWNTYIGKKKGISKCLCCGDKEISQMDFECGHVLAHINGGKNTVENLRPICSLCNKSMGTTHMFEFMKLNGFS